mgnify:CR=1 FL=1
MLNLIRSIWTQLWLTGVVCLVLLALYTSLGRQLTPLIETYKKDIEVELTSQLGISVEIGSLEGGWNWFSPTIKVNQLVLQDSDSPNSDNTKSDNTIEVQQISAKLDVSASLFYRSIVFDSIEISGVHLSIIQDKDSAWWLGDLLLSNENNTSQFDFLNWRWQGEKPLWLDLLGRQGELHFYDWQLDIQQFSAPVKSINLLDVRLRNNGMQHWLDGQIQAAQSGAILRAQLEIEGDLWDISQHNGKGFIELDTRSWKDWIPDFQSNWRVDEISLGAKLWFEVDGGLLHTLDGYIEIPDFSLTKDDNNQTGNISLQQGRITLAGRRDNQDWHLWFDSDLQWLSRDMLPIPKGRVSWLSNSSDTVHAGGFENGFQLVLNEVDLGITAGWLKSFNVLDSLYTDYISNLDPKGTVSNIKINVIPENQWLWAASLDLKEGSVNGWNGIPAAKNLNAQVQMNAQKGVLKLQDNNVHLHFPEMYQKGWDLDHASANIFWDIQEEYLKLTSPEIVSTVKNAQLRGGFSFYTPLKDAVNDGVKEGVLEPQLNLMLGIQNLNLVEQKTLVPNSVADEISGWLNDNIKSGRATNAGFIFSGSIDKNSPPFSQTIQLYADVKDTRLTYLPEWPEVKSIDARVMVDAPDVDIAVHNASTLGGELAVNSTQVTIRSTETNTWLTLSGKLNGSASEGLQYLQNTPLQSLVGGAFDQWLVKGDLSSELYAHIPLKPSEDKSKIRLATQLQKVDVDISDLDLSFNQLDGEVVFDSEDGLSAEGITAQAFSGNSLVDITSIKQGDGFDININAQGNAQIEAIKTRLPLFILKPIKGQLDYDANFLIRPMDRGGLELVLNSDLVGVDIETPMPFEKAAENPTSFNMQMNQGRDLRISFRYGTLANGVIAMDDGLLSRGQIYLGTAQAYLPSDEGLSISGNIDSELNAKAWWELWNSIKPEPEMASPQSEMLSPQSETTQTSSLLTSIDVSASSINAWQQPMGATHIVGTHRWGQWLFDLDSQLIKGKIIMPDDLETKFIKMDLEYIHMPVNEDNVNNTTRFGSSDTVDSLADFDPSWIPNTDLKVSEIFLGTSNYGRWDLAIRKKEHLTRISIKDSDSKSLKIKGDVDWSKDELGHKTHLNLLRLTTKNLGDTQRAFRKAAALEAKKSQFDIDLTWTGSPVGFNYASLNGLAKIKVESGVLVNDNAGALKAFGVLNFDTISRRLQLDFSDLYEEGLVFDSLKTRLKLDNGIATFVDPLRVDGPSAKFQSNGMIDFNTEEIDQKLVVTFPITSSLPIVAVLAGFAPQIAGAIYVTEKLIGEELERFTSASYTIGGTIEDPKMSIDKAFDNDIEGKETRSLKNRFLDIFGLGDDE